MSPNIENSKNSYKKGQKRLPTSLLLLLVVFPLFIIGLYTSLKTFKDLYNFTLSRREAIAFLAAISIKEKLDRVIDVGVSLATRVQFRKLIESAKWDEAIKILEGAPKDFSYIDRVALFDPQGTLWAATSPTPEILAVIGQNFAYRDYYQGVRKNWEPYVSESFKPAVPLGYNLVSVAIPIKSEPDQKILGIVLLTVKLDTVVDWTKGINVGLAGFIYIVDQKGNLVAHPTFSSEKDIINFSSVPAVQKVLRGERGLEVLFNPLENEKHVTAFEPVSDYGWGVVVVQPTRTAFVERNRAVGRLAAVWALVLVAVSFFMYRLLRDRDIMKAQRDRERILLESIGDGIVAISLDWHITLWNKAAGRISGWTQKEVLGKPFRGILKFIREQDRKENITFIEEAIVYAEPRMMSDHTILITKDGKEIPVADGAGPIIGSDGKVTGAIIIFRDISKEREVSSLRSDFAYSSHQLRTPVNKALWSLELALEEVNPIQIKENTRIAYDSVKSVHRLSEQIINVSEIDQGTVIPDPKSLTLSNLINEAIKALSDKATLKRITISSVKIPKELVINSDYKLLKRVLLEILENAVDYNVIQGTIKVRAVKQGEGILIEVEDSGIGVSESEKSFVFTKFFRGTNFSTTEISGAGLGLYIARECIKLLGGKIWFTSQERQGTTFSIFLPITRT